MDWFTDLDYTTKCIYFAVVLLLVVLIFMSVMGGSEHASQPNYVYSSTRLAHINQCDTLSAANQGDPSSCMSEIETGSLEDPAKQESLTSNPEGLDLWAVGHDMAAFKASVTGQTEGLSPNRQGMNMQNMTQEHQANPEDDMYEQLLHQQVLIGA